MLIPERSNRKLSSNLIHSLDLHQHRCGVAASVKEPSLSDATHPIDRHNMEDAIERLFFVGIHNQRQIADVIDAFTPSDVSRQEVAFNIELVACEGLSLSGRTPTKSLLIATNYDFGNSDKASSDRQVSRSFWASTARQLAAIACYFAFIYAVGLLILAREVGFAAAIPLAVKTCAGKSLVAALIGPWIQRLTGVSAS